MQTRTIAAFAATLVALAMTAPSIAADDAAQIAAQDTAYQLAVERNDWQTMDRILHPEMTLVLGNGTVIERKQLIDAAKNRSLEYEKQVVFPGTQKVRMYGKDTGTVTALLWLKGKRSADKSEFEYKLWFTDTYVRTEKGWLYAFGQASLRLPEEKK